MDTSSPSGTWFLKTWSPDRDPTSSLVEDRDSLFLWPVVVRFPADLASGGIYTDEWRPDEGARLDHVQWDRERRVLQFQHTGSGRWFRVRIVEGILNGRFTNARDIRERAPPSYDPDTYPNHVTGWNQGYIDEHSSMRCFEIVFNLASAGLVDPIAADVPRREAHQIPDSRVAIVRMDQREGRWFGTFKVFGWPTFNGDPMYPRSRGAGFVQRLGETFEYDLEDIIWSGRNVTFSRRGRCQPSGGSGLVDVWTEVFTGEIDAENNRRIRGTYIRTIHDRALSSLPEVPVVSGPRTTGTWRGVRSCVLAHGLKPKSDAVRRDWQERVRTQLKHLMIGPHDIVRTRSCVGAGHSSQDGIPPEWPVLSPADRDDINSARTNDHGRRIGPFTSIAPGVAYHYHEFHLEVDMLLGDEGSTTTRPSHTRRIHGFIAVPDGLPPAQGFPVAISLDGHGGSAFVTLRPKRYAATDLGGTRVGARDSASGCQLVNLYNAGERCWFDAFPDSDNYHGDSFARRNYVVIAVDISHRGFRPTPLRRVADGMHEVCSVGERRAYHPQSPFVNTPPPRVTGEVQYDGTNGADGDDPVNGNALHSWIAPEGDRGSSDWVENGERVWDVQQALSFLFTEAASPTTPLTNGSGPLLLDPSWVLVMGLSLGGEVATLVAALDVRIKLAIPAGFSPDLSLLNQSTANHPCGQWVYAEFAEYVDTSDYHALIAPRPLIVQTQETDNGCSSI